MFSLFETLTIPTCEHYQQLVLVGVVIVAVVRVEETCDCVILPAP